MTDYTNRIFTISIDVPTGNEMKCPMCNDVFTVNTYAVVNDLRLPLCDLCAWDKAPGLANLLTVKDDLNRFYQGEPPVAVWEALKQRESDPKRLKKELQKDYDSISSNGPLGEFLKNELRVALDGKDVKKLKAAKLLFEETKRGITTSSYADLDAEIPF